ncbi:MAG: rRNA methyltransferase [Bacteroidetes bacterium]|jgi:16S rRNA (adenine1518-N6/adenine1519-N6)-dimethyltransferase|nr:rRNA methyltransferase [Bacteroidota bacterium]
MRSKASSKSKNGAFDESAGLRPRKSLGQNFLRDDRISRKIVLAIDLRPADVVLEIGPGEGALTRHLAASGARLVLVELDERAVGRMRELYGGSGVQVLHQDVLTVDLDALAASMSTERLRVVGNIPYYITSPILFHVLDNRHRVRDLTMMVQKEVARRLAAVPRTKEYGILSVFCQLFADVEILFDVQPGSFHPRPDVTSSVVRLVMLDRPRYALRDEQFFREMVRSVYGMRRKTLRNALRYFLDADPAAAVPDASILQRRPEDLTIEETVGLSNFLFEHFRR